MYPPYRYMDPYPQTYSHHRDQNANAYPYYYPPSWESMPPQMKLDSSRPPLNSGPWAYNSHMNPDCNACCNHSYPPGYYSYRPPYSHFQPPPQLYYHGPYPPFSDSYPAYFVPPPSYSVDKPIYDYDKDRTHCCGCANHTCHKREDNSVKIEEQNPEEEEKGSDSAKLIRLPNYPHPVVWIPPSLTRDREVNKSAASQPGFWIPLDLNSLKGLRQGGEEKKNWQNEEKKAQSPLPIVWMPSHGKPEEVVKELKEANPNPKVNPNLKVPEELRPTFKIIPLKVHENDNRTEKPGVTGDESSKPIHSEVRSTDKENKIKIVPVKQLKEEDEKKLMVQEKVKEKSDDKNGAGARKEENVSNKSSDKKETPSAKSSKLPPVCLRVDPLPRRKTANRTSRSPSPPAKKQEEKKDNMYDPKDAKEEKQKKEIKAIDIDDHTAKQVDKDHQKKETVVPVTFMREMPNGIPVVEVREDESKQKVEHANVLKASDGVHAGAVGSIKGEEISNNMTCESPKNEKMEERKERRSLSSTDAAVLIQSAYRGFEVRRWQPLEKLKKIAHIHKQAGDIRRQIDDIETSSKQLEPKQKMVIGETIMNLLLQLDTIQGLHPSVREIRKSVARELVCLQEKLDSLVSQENQEQEPGKIDVDTITSDQVQSITGLSVEGEPNHVDKSLRRPLDENNMVKQQPDNEALETGSEQGVHAEVTKYMEPLLPTEDEIVSPSNADFVEHSLEEKPISGTEMALESHPVDLEQCSGVEDPGVLPATLGCEPEVLNKAPAFGVMELSEAERTVKSDELGPLSHELPDSRAGSSQVKEDGLIVDECSLSPMEKASNLDKSVVLNTDECGEVADECGEVTDSGFGLSQAEEDEQIVEECSLSLAKEASDLKEAILNTNECGTGESDFGTGMSFLQQETSLPETQEEPKVQAQVVEEGGHAEEVLEDGDYLICQTDSEPIIYQHSPSATLKAESMETTAEEYVESTIMAGNSTEMHDEILVQSESYPSETLENASEEKPGNYTDSPVEPGLKVATSDAMGLEPVVEQSIDEEGSQALTEEVGVDHPGLAGEPSVELNIDEYSSQAVTGGATDSHEEVVLPVPHKRGTTEETKLLEENEKLREMLERLLEAGKQQLGVISDLNGRVKDLEKKLSQNKKKTKVRRHNRGSLRCSSLQQKV